MNKNEIMTNLTRAFHRTGLKFKKHSPEILLVTGIIGGVASAVLACKATTKVQAVLDESKDKVEAVHESLERGYVPDENGDKEEYTQETKTRDLTIIYTQTGLKLVKLYAPALTLGVLSVTSLLASNNIMRKRNVGLAAAYAAVDKGFKEYRGRVVDRFGDGVDRELRYNIKAREIEEKIIDENGEEKTVKKIVEVADGNGIRPASYSEFAICYDNGNTGWRPDAEANKAFLIGQQRWANDKLQRQGHLFLNEVFDMLGAPRTKMGNVVGWIYNKEHQGHVDFGMFDIWKEQCRDFAKGIECVLWLDFNVDGPILDLI